MADDLLAAVERGERTVDDAATELEAYIDSIHRGDADPDWPIAMGLSEAEATAYLHGADIPLMLEMRRTGSTITCARCGGMIDVRGGHWAVDQELGWPVLVHLECPTTNAR